MANRRGISTKIILAIGILVLTAIILIAASRFTAPLFYGTAEYATEEVALSVDAVYAAPEDAEYVIKLPAKVRDDCTVTFGKDGNNEIDICSGILSKFTKINKPDTDEDIVFSCDQIPSVYDCFIFNPDKLSISKKYDENIAGKEKMRITSF